MATTTQSKGIKYWDDHDAYGDDDRETRRLINAMLREDFAHDPLTTTGLTYGYRQGVGYSGTFSIIPAATVALVDDDNNYVERTVAGAVSVNQAGFTAGRLPMAVVTTVGGEITAIVDYRAADALVAGAVLSVFGRNGAVVADAADYAAFYAALVHTHAMSDVTGLVSALNDLVSDITALVTGKVDLAGDTMTGPLILDADPATDLGAATKQYVDDAIAGAGGYTDEQAQDAVGAMVDDATIEYDDATPLLQVKDGGITPAKASAALKTFVIPLIIGNGTDVIATGEQPPIYVPVACTIIGWVIGGGPSGDIVIDSWLDSHANFPPTVADTMWGTKPSITGGVTNKGTGLSIAVAADSWIIPNVDSVTDMKRVNLSFIAVKD